MEALDFLFLALSNDNLTTFVAAYYRSFSVLIRYAIYIFLYIEPSIKDNIFSDTSKNHQFLKPPVYGTAEMVTNLRTYAPPFLPITLLLHPIVIFFMFVLHRIDVRIYCFM